MNKHLQIGIFHKNEHYLVYQNYHLVHFLSQAHKSILLNLISIHLYKKSNLC